MDGWVYAWAMRRLGALAVAITACSGSHGARRDAARGDVPAAATGSAAATGAAAAPTVTPVPLPGGEGGIGFDDLQFAPAVGVLAPAGRTGALDLVDGAGRVRQVTGFSSEATYGGGHGEGTTSAAVFDHWIFAIDRTAMQLVTIDLAKASIVHRTKLAASPDYVRWVGDTGEVWVTEPDAEQIELFGLDRDGGLGHIAMIRVEGGPESLVVGERRGRIYSHLWNGKSVAIDPMTRSVVATWPNGCKGSRGIALEEERGWLFAGCSEGGVTVLDVNHDGALVGRADTGAGVDIIAYAPALHRLYVPSAKTGTLAVLAVDIRGALTSLASVPIATGSHCATTDGAGTVWVCDPEHGQLLAVTGLP